MYRYNEDFHKYGGDKGYSKYSSKESQENDYDKFNQEYKRTPSQDKNYGIVDSKQQERKTVYHGDYQGEIFVSSKGNNISKGNRNNDLSYGYNLDQTKNYVDQTWHIK